MNAKETVRNLLDELPEECSLVDVVCHLHVLELLERDAPDAEQGEASRAPTREELRSCLLGEGLAT